MKQLLPILAAILLPSTAWAEGDVRIDMVSWHLTPAAEVSTTYNAVCRERTYRFTTSTQPNKRRPTAVAVAIGTGTASQTVDLTSTALGTLLTDETSVGELTFACRPGSLFVFYRGASQADAESRPVAQNAVFVVRADGHVSIPPKEGVTETPLPR